MMQLSAHQHIHRLLGPISSRPLAALGAILHISLQTATLYVCILARCDFLISQVSFGNVSLHVYEGNDIVSGFLAGQEHTWESSEIQQMLWGLRQHTSPQQAAVKAKQQQDSSSNTQQQMPLFVDVGANVGWFALNAAAAGARVAAFEGVWAAILVPECTCALLLLDTRMQWISKVAVTALSGLCHLCCYIMSQAISRTDQ